MPNAGEAPECHAGWKRALEGTQEAAKHAKLAPPGPAKGADKVASWMDFRVRCPLAIRYVVATRLRARVQASKRRCRSKFSSAKYGDALAGAENMMATALIRIIRDMRHRGVDSILLPAPLGSKTASQLAKEVCHARSEAFKHRTEKLALHALSRFCPPELEDIVKIVSRADEFAAPGASHSKQRSFSPVLPPIDECQPVVTDTREL